jgi:O-acetyl-ADP-ribose deacetylase (regulator of RNase III)
MANLIGAETISIPAISSGALNFPKKKCAEKMILRIA